MIPICSGVVGENRGTQKVNSNEMSMNKLNGKLSVFNPNKTIIRG